MKKSLLFISMLIAGATNSIAQTIPNPGFESFSGGGATNWGHANGLLTGLVTKATAAGDINSGISAIKLTTKTSGGFIYPGIAASKSTVTLTGVSAGGFPWTSRSTSLEGFAKYIPVGSDTAIISVFYTKWNGTSRDTIGGGSLEITIGYSTFGAFSVPISFIDFRSPDTCQIVLASSDTSGAVGSALYVDDLSFISPPPMACNPDPNIPTTGTAPTILPPVTDTIIETPGAMFDQTFTIYVPSNFDFAPPGGAGGGITIQGTMDSVKIEGFGGLPPSFTVTCGTPDCMVYGGQVGCVKVVGPMPNVDDVLYNFDLTISPYGIITGPSFILPALPSTHIEDIVTNQALASYAVKVGNPVIIGIESFGINGFDVSQNKPNPFDVGTMINFTCPVSGNVDFIVTDVLGRQVYDTNINAAAGANTFTFSTDLSSGTYFYSLSDGTNTITRKMVITE